MRKAIVTVPFFGVEDGKIYPRNFAAGEMITGELAMSEVANGRASWGDAEDGKKPPRNKVQTAPIEKTHTLSLPQAQALPEKTAKKRRGRPKRSQ